MSRLLLLLLMLFSAPVFAQTDNRFSDTTFYDARVISTSPLRVQYALHGEGRFRPKDFASLDMDGTATLVFAYGHDEAMLYAPQVEVDADQNYGWRFPGWRNEGRVTSLASVLPVREAAIPLQFIGPLDQRPLLDGSFIVEFNPGVEYDPSRVHIQVVYLKFGPTAPHIDVFRNAANPGG